MIGKKFSLNYQVIGEFLLQSQMNTSNSYFLEDIYQVPANSIMHFSFSDKLSKQKSKEYWNFPLEEADHIELNNIEQIIINKSLSNTDTILSCKNKCNPARFDLIYNMNATND